MFQGKLVTGLYMMFYKIFFYFLKFIFNIKILIKNIKKIKLKKIQIFSLKGGVKTLHFLFYFFIFNF